MNIDTPRPTVLVVDDDQALLRLVDKTLGSSGYAMLTAESGISGLALVQRNRVDLVLLDLGLPNMDGRTLASRLRTHIPPVPFVIITGRTDVLTAVDMMKQGALDYLMKDAQFLDFLPSVVERALLHVDRERRLAAAEGELRHLNAELEQRVRDRTAQLHSANQLLQEALSKVKTLTGLLPICSYCKDIRDERGEWHPMEQYIVARSQASFSHGLCPACLEKHHSDIADVVLLKVSQRSQDRPISSA
jgi:FixJ family two-component response regulator